MFCAGQIPIDPATGNLIAGDVRAQTERVLQNVKAILDDGAVRALKANKSLLAMGIVAVDGDFESGDAVLITDKAGAAVYAAQCSVCHGDHREGFP